MAHVQMDFYSDWIATITAELTADGYTPPAGANQREVCLRYFNYQKRRVARKRRSVHFSKEFQVPPGSEGGLAALKEKMEKGEDLRPHLSTRLSDLDYNDGMLNDWGIHHFHLGTAVDAKGFVNRTRALLYAKVLSDAVLCIQILTHKDFANRDLIDIWHKNWPQTLEPYRLVGFASAPQPDAASLTILRRNVSCILQIPGAGLFAPPGGGVTTAGVATDVAMRCNSYRKLARDLERHVASILDQLIATAAKEGFSIPQDSVFHLVAYGEGFAAVEESTHWGFKLCDRI